LIDTHATPATEASGNPAAAFMPYFTADWSSRGQFYASAFSYSQAFYGKAPLTGGLLLDSTPTRAQHHAKLIAKLGVGEEVLRAVNASEASHIAGVPLPFGGLYAPLGGSVSMADTAKALLAKHASHITYRQASVHHVRKQGECWQLLDEVGAVIAESTSLILACGVGALKLLPELPLEAVRGQLSLMAENDISQRLKTVLNFDGYLTPAQNGLHVLGSSYQRHDRCSDIRHTDALAVQEKLRCLPVFDALTATHHWAAVRVASRDRMPLIGEYHEGLYLSLAHGSRGSLSCPFAGEILASTLCDEPLPLPHKVVEAVSPKRFFKTTPNADKKNTQDNPPPLNARLS
jgi:tRNA 5-methylaminomethyl-2-thiouridine biosynthesis bifunctional protein